MYFGALLGSEVSAVARVIYYEQYGLMPNIGPQIGYIMYPILVTPISIFAIIIQIIFHKFFAYQSYFQWGLAGLSWGLIFLVLVTPWLAILFLVFNPVSLKYVWEHCCPVKNK